MAEAAAKERERLQAEAAQRQEAQRRNEAETQRREEQRRREAEAEKEAERRQREEVNHTYKFHSIRTDCRRCRPKALV